MQTLLTGGVCDKMNNACSLQNVRDNGKKSKGWIGTSEVLDPPARMAEVDCLLLIQREGCGELYISLLFEGDNIWNLCLVTVRIEVCHLYRGRVSAPTVLDTASSRPHPTFGRYSCSGCSRTLELFLGSA